ncbi:MAG: hypothetical protein Q8P15_03970 [Nanoarchaeota archaeon]|nr:hypothetical protein [Nanoarchaeota archaeon]
MKDINLFKTESSIYLKEVSSKSQVSKSDDCDGYLIRASEKEARRIVDSLKGSNKIIAVWGGDDSFNRRVVETMKIDYLVSPESGEKKDNLKQRDSGLNHVVAKEASKKKIAIVVSMSGVSSLEGKGLAVRLSRIIQNIKICRRAKCEIKIASFGKNKNEVFDVLGRSSFGTSLGMSSQQVKGAVGFFQPKTIKKLE